MHRTHQTYVMGMQSVIIVILCMMMGHISAMPSTGAIFRVTEKGINYAATEAIKSLGANLQGQTIPDQSGKAGTPIGHVKYELTQMRIVSLSLPTVSADIQSSGVIQWKSNGGGLKVTGHWKYRYLFIKDSGHFDITVSGINFGLGVGITDSGHGRPYLKAAGCSANIADVSVKFHGGASWLYNLFDSNVERSIRHHLNELICNKATDTINTDGNKAVAKADLNVKIDTNVMLDLSLSKNPVFTDIYLDLPVKGKASWKNEDSPTSLTPPVIPSSSNSSQMMYLWITDYVMDTLGEVYYKHGLIQYYMTQADLGADQAGLFNTSCSFICIGTTVRQLGKKFPNGMAEFQLTASKPPSLTIAQEGLSADFWGTLECNVRLLKDDSKHFAFSLNAYMSAQMVAELKQNATDNAWLIHAKITDYKFNLTLVKSEIGHVPVENLDWLFKSLIRPFVHKKLNGLGAKGITLPHMGDVEVINPSLVWQKNNIIIATDLVKKKK